MTTHHIRTDALVQEPSAATLACMAAARPDPCGETSHELVVVALLKRIMELERFIAEPVSHYDGVHPDQGPCGCERCLLDRIAALEQALGDAPPDGFPSWEDWPNDGCLVQRTKGGGGYVGNAVLWWKRGDCGYTTNPFDARIWTTNEAVQFTEGREDDYVAWPICLIRKHISAIVDMQECPKKSRIAALAAAKKEAGITSGDGSAPGGAA